MKFRYDTSALHDVPSGGVAPRSAARAFDGSGINSVSPSRQVWMALRRHWLKSLSFFIVACGAVVAVLMFAPRKYASEAKLFVRVGRESVALDPTATTGETISLQRENEIEMNSIVELLHSRNLLEAVVDTLGTERILEPPPASEGADASRGPAWKLVQEGLQGVKGVADGAVGWIRDLDPISPRDRAIDALQKSLDVTITKRSSVVSVSCRANNPQLAHDIVNALVKAYLDEHRRVNRTEGSYEFFRDQSELARLELATAHQSMADAKNELGLLSVDLQKTMLHERRSANELDRAKVEAELAAAESRIASLQELMEPVSPRIATEEISGHDHFATDNMRAKLYDLEVKKAQLLSQYRANHPLVLAIEQQLTEARRVYEAQPSERSRATSSVNPTYQQLELNLLTERSHAAALKSQVDALKSQREEVLAEISKLNENESRLVAMEGRIDVLAADYRAQLNKLEQSRINDALEQQQISNVNIAQPATLVAKPVSPNKLVVLLLGLMIAFGGALLLPFWLEWGSASAPLVAPVAPVDAAPVSTAERISIPEGPPRKVVPAKQQVPV